MQHTIRKLIFSCTAAGGLLIFSTTSFAQSCGTTNIQVPKLTNVKELASGGCQFSYKLSPGRASKEKLQNVQVGIPCGVTIKGAGIQQSTCSEGGPNDKFLQGYPATVATITIPAGSKASTVAFEADTCEVGKIGIGLKTANSFETCMTKGPAPDPARKAAVSYSCNNFDEMDIDPGNGQALLSNKTSVMVSRGNNGCITGDIKVYKGLDCKGNATTIQPSQPSSKFVYAGGFGAQACPEIVEAKTGSPFLLYRIVSGGTPYLFCIDLANGNLVALSFCGV